MFQFVVAVEVNQALSFEMHVILLPLGEGLSMDVGPVTEAHLLKKHSATSRLLLVCDQAMTTLTALDICCSKSHLWSVLWQLFSSLAFGCDSVMGRKG